MELKDYLKSATQGRRILIVSDAARGQALIRGYEKKTGIMVRNINCMTINMIVDVMYNYMLSEAGYDEERRFLDNMEAVMLFKDVLIKNIGRLKYFNDEKMMNPATVREVFNKAMLVRANRWNGKEENGNARISDLKLLIAEYENKLEIEKLLDRITKEELVLKYISSLSERKSELENIFFAEISYLAEDIKTFSRLESDILESVINSYEPAVFAFEEDLRRDTFSGCRGKAEFYRGYGSFNEASFAANDIFEKGYPFGNVLVLYSSDEQLPSISAALRGNGIPMKLVSSYSAKENAYVSLSKRIINWALADYSEKKLDAILSSPVIYIEETDQNGDKKNLLSGQDYFAHVADANNRREDSFVLGWGYERNIEFVEHELNIADTDSRKKILEMHRTLLEVFGDNGKAYDEKNPVCPSALFEKLKRFIEKYTVRGKEYAIGVDALSKISSALSFEKRKLALREALTLIVEFLDGITMSDEADNSSVTVRSMRDWSVPERPNVYMIGLALKDMQGNTTESPVLSDDEMEKFLAKGYVPTVKNEAERREMNMRYTVSLFSGESIVFGYSDYDTVNFVENNASTFFREALNKLSDKEIKDLPEFVYGNPAGGSGNVSATQWNNKPSYDVRLKTSSSSLEVLLDCPKKYAFEKMMYIPDNEFTECDFGHWLDARLRGTFFHEIAEKYCNSKLVLPATEKYGESLDENFIKQLAENIENKLLNEAPCAIRRLADKETADITKDAIRYLQKLLDELNESESWRVLEAEKSFAEAAYPVTGFDSTKYDFEFRGSIDRIDYRVDKVCKKCFIRIIDYKTGKKEKKENGDALGKLIQYAVYEKALMETGKTDDGNGVQIDLIEYVKNKVAELEQDDSVKDYTYEFDCFRYDFPMEKNDEEPITIPKDNLEGTNIIRLKSILAILGHKQMYPDHKEFRDILEELSNDYPADGAAIKNLKLAVEQGYKAEIDNCDYCTYKYLCINRKAGEI